MNLIYLKYIFFLILICTQATANVQLIKKENPDSNTTLLVIAGIHGDESGGYFAASILASHYKITNKNLWIVPNLNTKSIQADTRGLNGDMNRKFSFIKEADKDALIIKEIKEIILSKNVSLVLNLHDGHGFYRKENQGNIFNPNSWGQTCVIDQVKLKQLQPFGDLNTIASTVKTNMNKKLLQKHHSFDVKNTNTKFEDEDMRLSLTYYAVTNNKPAFAIESSKNLSSLSEKVFYQLLAIEEFMNVMQISYTRDFALDIKELGHLIQEYGSLTINNNIVLDFTDIKKSLSYIPIESNRNEFKFSHPLGSINKDNGIYLAYIGNQHVTTLRPQYFKIAEGCPKNIDVNIDGTLSTISAVSDFFVTDDFIILEGQDFRVNVIGFTSMKTKDESGLKVSLDSINKKFSVDKSNRIYRIEFYKNDEFCSMSMVHFK